VILIVFGCPTGVVQGPQDPQLVHGVEHVVLGRRVHEVEEQQVLHAQRLEQQHHVGQVGPLDLRDGGGQHLVLVGALRVQPVQEDRGRKTGRGRERDECSLLKHTLFEPSSIVLVACHHC